MSLRRRPRLKYVAGGDRKTFSKRGKPKGLRRFEVEEWYRSHSENRPYAAIANRRLRFAAVNELLNDRPPSIVRHEDGFRIYLFRDGQDRDIFVENFHFEFKARAIIIGTGNAS